jgi:glutaredoxin-related protein
MVLFDPLKMVVHELDNMGEPRNGPVQHELEKITGVVTVPQVFINGCYFGNAADVDKMVTQKSLRSRLQEQGVL